MKNCLINIIIKIAMRGDIYRIEKPNNGIVRIRIDPAYQCRNYYYPHID
jgi:hypothetical protein